MCEQLKLRLVT